MPVARHLLLVVLTALALGLAGCGEDDPPAAPAAESRAKPSPVQSGSTALNLGATIKPLLELAGIALEPVGAATKTDDGVSVPISGGTIGAQPVAGRLDHDGGIRFSAGSATVEATALRLDLRTGTVTADVEGERMTLLQAEFGPARVSDDAASVALTGEEATISDEALVLINETMGSELVPAGLSIGELRVDARWR